MPVVENLTALRVVSTVPLESVDWPQGAVVLPIAPDEALVLGPDEVEIPQDPKALVEIETGFCAVEMTRSALEAWLEQEAEWRLPSGGGFSQGMAAGLPVKVWVDGDTALLLTRASLAVELEDRL